MSSFKRSIERNILKQQQGNNNIKKEWEIFLNYKYSLKELKEMNRKNRKKK